MRLIFGRALKRARAALVFLQLVVITSLLGHVAVGSARTGPEFIGKQIDLPGSPVQILKVYALGNGAPEQIISGRYFYQALECVDFRNTSQKTIVHAEFSIAQIDINDRPLAHPIMFDYRVGPRWGDRPPILAGEDSTNVSNRYANCVRFTKNALIDQKGEMGVQYSSFAPIYPIKTIIGWTTAIDFADGTSWHATAGPDFGAPTNAPTSEDRPS